MASSGTPPTLGERSQHASSFQASSHMHSSLGRRFIGPMPAARVDASLPRAPRRLHRTGTADVDASSGADSTSGSDSDGNGDGHIRAALRAHARRYFLAHGGAEAEWGEGTEARVRAEMRRRWRASEWGRVARGASADAHQKRRWVGTSFTVGEIPGVGVPERAGVPNVLPDAPRSTSPTPAVELEASTPPAGPLRRASSKSRAGASTVNTFFTARSGMSVVSSEPAHDVMFALPLLSADMDMDAADSTTRLVPPGPAASTPALAPAADRPMLKAMLSTPANYDGLTDTPKRGAKGRTARFAETEVAEAPPAPPRDVLARQGTRIAETSAGAAAVAAAENSVKWGDVVMEDRMLVRVSHCRAELAGAFDEEKCRSTRQDTHDWAEFRVVWRKDELQLFQDNSLAALGLRAGAQKLVYTIRLGGASTALSLFCFVDMTFAIRRPHTHLGSRGTEVFVFKHQARSRAVDWHWALWRQMGGSLPPTVEIRCPALDLGLQVHIPAPEDWARVYAAAACSRVLDLCENALRGLPEWDFLRRRATDEHAGQFALAWRVGGALDWAAHEDDLDGHARPWAVLWGLALRQPGTAPHLEFRLAPGAPARVHLPSGRALTEPPGIEGYLDRIRPNSRTRIAVYVATHAGNLVFARGARGYPPPPPGAPRPGGGEAGADEDEDAPGVEARRGARQILDADGVFDMRSVLVVRRAFADVAIAQDVQAAQQLASLEHGALEDETLERDTSDDEDAGGEEALTALGTGPPRTRVRTRRSFELVLKNGQIVRLEAYSRNLALEWIERLRNLIAYHHRRHELDARAEMDIGELAHSRVTPHRHPHHTLAHADPPPPPRDRDASAPALAALFPRHAFAGGRAVIKFGTLFARQGTRGPYRHVALALVAGHAVQFALRGGSAFHRRRPGASVQLAHAHVLSGALAAQALPAEQYKPNAPALARRYADGLESADAEEDTLFVLWYRPGPVGAALADEAPPVAAPEPRLARKHKLLVFRTRSKLERDAWCFALNTEIERLVRDRRAVART